MLNSVEDLDVFKLAHQLAVKSYQGFPKEELFNLGDQTRHDALESIMAHRAPAKNCAQYSRSAIGAPTQHRDAKQKADASQPGGSLELRIGNLRVYCEAKPNPA